MEVDFPSFLEGLSLRQAGESTLCGSKITFPFLLGGAFIEAHSTGTLIAKINISLPSWRGFH